MPKMKKDIMKARKRDDNSDDDLRPTKKLPLKNGKEKKKIKKKRKPDDSSLSKMNMLKNGKKKLKKELGKNKLKNERKEKLLSKAQKTHYDPQTRPNSNKKDENVLFPCGACGKEVNDNDEAIMCEAGCSYWYHRICTGMGNDAYALLTNEDNAEWVCDQCIATKTIPLVRVH